MIDGGISVSVGTGSRSLRPARPAVFALAVVFAACGAAPASATSLVNLLVNPGAEQQPVTSHGWTAFPGGGDWTIPRGDDDGGIGTHSGDNFFWPGQSLNGYLYQIVDLTGYQAWMGDDGAHSAYFVGYLGSWSGDGDVAWVAVEALDENGGLIDYVSSTPSSPDVWTRVELKLPLPAGTTQIRVGLYADRVSGLDNNGYFDDVGLYLPPPNLLVNPGAELQPVTNNGWTQTLGDWTIARGDDAGGIGTHSGDNFFWGGQSAAAELLQEIDLSPYRGWIGDGNRTVEFTGYIGSWSGDDDEGRILMRLVDDQDNVINTIVLGTASPDSWQRFSQIVPLPAATAKIRVRLIATRLAGSDNNAYFDDIGVYLPAINLLVNPGAELQPVTANGWNSANGDWTIARGDDGGGIGTHSGENFFWAGQSAAGHLVQMVDVSSYRGWLGNGAQKAFQVAYKGSWSGDGDTAETGVGAFDADANPSSNYVNDGPSSPDVWTRSEVALNLPSWTASLMSQLLSTRVAGSDNNGYFDDMHLQLEAPDWLFDADTLFRDGFEVGSAAGWSVQVP